MMRLAPPPTGVFYLNLLSLRSLALALAESNGAAILPFFACRTSGWSFSARNRLQSSHQL
jgi:hypothetical protein